MHRPEEVMIFFYVSIQCATTIYAKALWWTTSTTYLKLRPNDYVTPHCNRIKIAPVITSLKNCLGKRLRNGSGVDSSAWGGDFLVSEPGKSWHFPPFSWGMVDDGRIFWLFVQQLPRDLTWYRRNEQTWTTGYNSFPVLDVFDSISP